MIRINPQIESVAIPKELSGSRVLKFDREINIDLHESLTCAGYGAFIFHQAKISLRHLSF